MKQPLWILNSILVLVLLACLGFIFFKKVSFPTKYSIKPKAYTPPVLQKEYDVDRSKIYMSDLFNTYKPEIPKPKEPELVKELPLPPQPTQAPMPQPTTPKFLEPLSITLTGIFSLSDETKSRALIAENKSKKEAIYRVGDEIEDAQILRIYTNRIVLIRSNGQQETLFLQQADVDKFASPWFKKSWANIIKKQSPHVFLVDTKEFIKEIPSLGALIDMLDLTSVYKQGVPIGCKIGILDDSSFIRALGFQSDDIVKTVNNIEAATTANRLDIYNSVIKLKEGDKVVINLVRKGQATKITITLTHFNTVETPPIEGASTGSERKALTEKVKLQETRENIDILKRSKKFAPTYYELAQEEREQVLKHGKNKSRKLFK